MRIIIVILILALAPVPAMAKGCVILLHGLARTEASFVAMELALEGEHFEVVRPGYPSTTDTVAALADSTIPAALAA
ncbi:MAG: alpha/beta hydrolase, partial [Rhodobacteraceae bacterium]|nr:alpha/beta hydrolase [Paracoccaceae bacterium]